MRLLMSRHDAFLEHDTGPRHPERPARVEAVERGVRTSGVDVVEVEAPMIDRAGLALVHEAAYIDAIEGFCRAGGGALDMDTIASGATWEAALRAAGAVTVLIDELESRSDATGFAVSRPPGHHALPDRAMGFCLFNNVAIAAKLLRARGQRVAVLDWDVHHGNGTQVVLAPDPGALYVSLHQDQFYPYEGRLDDVEIPAKGTTVNVPLPAGTAGDVYRSAWTDVVLPVLEQFGADWVLVSAGYDAHVDDPLAGLSLTSDDYGFLSSTLTSAHPGNRVIVALEGGYDLAALEASAMATALGLTGIEPVEAPLESVPWAHDSLLRAKEAIAAHWDL